MNAELLPYKRYRSTGVPWIGEVPNHWGMERAKWLYQKMARPVRESDEIVTCFRDGIVTHRKNRRLDGFTNSLKEIGYQGVRRGDLVIHAMDAFAGAVGVSDSDGKSTPVYSVCTARRELDNRYYAYLVREMGRSQWILCLARGIRERSTDFRFQAFGAQPVPLPPLEEQRAIADYIDANAVKVRRFIRNRRRLIEVLNEQKQSIINRAVTRGIKPDVSLKTSGIDWLGDIPAYWDVVPLKRICGMKSGEGITSFDIEENGEYPVYGGNGLRGYMHRYTHDGEYALVGRQGALCGNVHLVCGRFWASEHAVVVSLLPGYCMDWFVALLIGMDLNQYSMAAAQPGLSVDRVINLRVPIPPAEEQKEIAKFIERETETIINALNRAQREISLIREYRTRLISDVVTGKVDVRHLAAPPGSEDLEEMAEALEPPEEDIADGMMDEEEPTDEAD